ncbi:hypothetical protein pipiens_008898 [Culex pipiens pipiens]|uniref:Uncharacterized protein n=1 Tax=Culex pipiens pipiens TaxID=38569 RepID=A0ABD1DG18_CULPP
MIQNAKISLAKGGATASGKGKIRPGSAASNSSKAVKHGHEELRQCRRRFVSKTRCGHARAARASGRSRFVSGPYIFGWLLEKALQLQKKTTKAVLFG